MHAPAPPPAVGVRLPVIPASNPKGSVAQGNVSLRPALPATPSSAYGPAAHPAAPFLAPRGIAVGPLGILPTDHLQPFGLTLTGPIVRGGIAIVTVHSGERTPSDGFSFRVFTGDGTTITARVYGPSVSTTTAIDTGFTARSTRADLAVHGMRTACVDPLRRVDTMRLLERWQRWLGTEITTFLLDRVIHTAEPNRPLVLEATYDARTGKPQSAQVVANTRSSAIPRAATSAVFVQIDLAEAEPIVRTVEGSIPPALRSLFGALAESRVLFPHAEALQERGLTNGLMAANLQIEPPIATRDALVAEEPRLVISVDPQQSLLTGAAWIWANGRRRIAGVPWTGVPVEILYETLATASGRLARFPLALELQPFLRGVDPRIAQVLAMEYFARRRPRDRGYGGSGADVSEIVFGGQPSLVTF